MKKLTVLYSVLVVALLLGQGLALADDAVKHEKKPCKVNFKPGHKLHGDKDAPATTAPAAK